MTLTLKAAQAAGSAPMTLTVAQDSSATKDNLAAFVTAYNTLRSTLDGLLKGVEIGLRELSDLITLTQLSLPGDMQPLWGPDQRREVP